MQPFEVWVNGAEQPRGLGAMAKTLSMDLRANDPAWLQLKLDALATVAEERSFEMAFRRTARSASSPAWWRPPQRWSAGAASSWRAAASGQRPTPVIDAMFSRDEPRTGPSGTLVWSVDVENPATGENFTLTLKEVTLPSHDGGIGDAALRGRLQRQLPAAMDGWRASCRWTCASSTRPGSA